MPGGDRTGPLGAGPMTGRAAGICAGYQSTGYMNSAGRFGGGRGFGRGQVYGGGQGGRGMRWGRGRGGRWGSFDPAQTTAWGAPNTWGYPGNFGNPALSREAELAVLQQQAAQVEVALNDIKKRMDELEQDQADKE